MTYEFQEYPKWINHPGGSVVVGSKLEEDELLGSLKPKPEYVSKAESTLLSWDIPSKLILPPVVIGDTATVVNTSSHPISIFPSNTDVIDIKSGLYKELDDLGIIYDRRWAVPRLQATLENHIKIVDAPTTAEEI